MRQKDRGIKTLRGRTQKRLGNIFLPLSVLTDFYHLSHQFLVRI